VRPGGHQLHRLIAGAGSTLALAAGAQFVVPGLTPSASARVDLSGSVQLSNERTFTRWAYPDKKSPIRKSPVASSKRMAKISMRTEDGFPEVYMLLRSWTDESGQEWLRIRIPMRPNGRIGWVDASALGQPHLVRTQLVVHRRQRRAVLHRAGQRIWRARIGVGKAGTPTPSGRFWIRERIRIKNGGGIYGPFAFGTSAYSRLSDWPGGGVIGIHGTNQPGLIPGRPSHGCIRVRNKSIRRLKSLMPVGTPVWIR
jgi:hypothetical protein